MLISWDKKEIAYQFVHMFIAFWSGFLLYELIYLIFSFKHWAFLLVGILVGFILEFTQYLDYKAKGTWREERLEDGIRDFCFYIVGCGLLFVVKLLPL